MAGANGSRPDARLKNDADGVSWVELSGAWNLRSLEPVLSQLESRLAQFKEAAGWDLREVSALDHAGALLLWRAWGRRMAERVNLRPEQELLFTHLQLPDRSQLPRRPRRWSGPLIILGRGMLSTANQLIDTVLLLGRVSLDCMHLARHPGEIPWREISANLYRTGTQALAITAVVGFLVGVVLPRIPW